MIKSLNINFRDLQDVDKNNPVDSESYKTTVGMPKVSLVFDDKTKTYHNEVVFEVTPVEKLNSQFKCSDFALETLLDVGVVPEFRSVGIQDLNSIDHISDTLGNISNFVKPLNNLNNGTENTNSNSDAE